MLNGASLFSWRIGGDFPLTVIADRSCVLAKILKINKIGESITFVFIRSAHPNFSGAENSASISSRPGTWNEIGRAPLERCSMRNRRDDPAYGLSSYLCSAGQRPKGGGKVIRQVDRPLRVADPRRLYNNGTGTEREVPGCKRLDFITIRRVGQKMLRENSVVWPRCGRSLDDVNVPVLSHELVVGCTRIRHYQNLPAIAARKLRDLSHSSPHSILGRTRICLRLGRYQLML